MSIGAYLEFLHRRKWLILAFVVVVPIVAFVLTMQQSDRYSSSSDVVISSQSLAASLTGSTDAASNEPVERILATQANFARSPLLLQRVVRASGHGITVASFLDTSSVDVIAGADVLRFSVTADRAALARSLANSYAQHFVVFRKQSALQSLEAARESVVRRIAVARSQTNSSALVEQLRQTEAQLRAREALQSADAAVIKSAASPEKVRPRPLRNALLALAIGVIFGFGFALFLELLDPHIDAPGEIAEALGLPLLGRLPERRGRRSRHSVASLLDPTSHAAETVDGLRLAVEFANKTVSARSIMVTSAVRGDGKSLTAAELAVTFAQAARRVVLLDLDLRRPALAKLLGRDERSGMTDVVRGDCSLALALEELDVAVGPRIRTRRRYHAISAPDHSRPLLFIGAGSTVDAPRAVIESPLIGDILTELKGVADLVLVDAPALLDHPDSVALSNVVDAMVVVLRREGARRRVISELRRVLASCPATKLGLILIDSRKSGADDYFADREELVGVRGSAAVRIPPMRAPAAES